ncbi:MAG: bifunctional UDP-N-acetylglucosamine diphosphorylase/glucosamine-1-phosphate N-acetyltransferase GlmU [Solirubrobacteraceae bacterium]|nr:MAG: UDP-N-acetylglucosamine diphosphorylase/glucosamine-1-phosphate N-acetyltransferase [Solirubrobacterales bacterium]
MPSPTVLILAAGEGTRMRSSVPKVLHPLCGRPMILWTIDAARAAGAARVVVVGGPERQLDGRLPEGVELAVQQRALGTGDAVRAAADAIRDAGTVVVLAADVPLVGAELIGELVSGHERAGAAATIVTMQLEDPSGYGRIVRAANGTVERVVETKDTSDVSAEELAINEVNTLVLAFDGAALLEALERVEPDAASGELYLLDVLPALREAGATVAAHRSDDAALTFGVNDRVDLARVTKIAQRRIHETHQRAGVTIVDPGSTLIDAGVEIAPDTVLEPSCSLRGATRIGHACRVGPLTTLIDTTLGDEVTVPHSYLLQCEVRAGANVGPFAYLRPGTVLEEGAKAGTFVEIKNSHIGQRAKIPHLSYVGDADVGERSNLGAGTITANYDGQTKHRTAIGADVKGGVDTSFVAPVKVGDGAWTAAGSVVTDDVPAGALALARARQRNIEGYTTRPRDSGGKGDSVKENESQPSGSPTPSD